MFFDAVFVEAAIERGIRYARNKTRRRIAVAAMVDRYPTAGDRALADSEHELDHVYVAPARAGKTR